MSTSLHDWINIYNARGKLEGEMIKSFLESQDVNVILTQESAGWIHGITVGSFGVVEVLVPPEQSEHAKSILKAMEIGEFVEDEDLQD
jgi:hypothetical protein